MWSDGSDWLYNRHSELRDLSDVTLSLTAHWKISLLITFKLRCMQSSAFDLIVWGIQAIYWGYAERMGNPRSTSRTFTAHDNGRNMIKGNGLYTDVKHTLWYPPRGKACYQIFVYTWFYGERLLEIQNLIHKNVMRKPNRSRYSAGHSVCLKGLLKVCKMIRIANKRTGRRLEEAVEGRISWEQAFNS